MVLGVVLVVLEVVLVVLVAVLVLLLVVTYRLAGYLQLPLLRDPPYSPRSSRSTSRTSRATSRTSRSTSRTSLGVVLMGFKNQNGRKTYYLSTPPPPRPL